MSGSVSILMPVYNELATVERAIDDALTAELPVESRQLVLVDDGSKDGTRELLQGRELPANVTFVLHDRNRGKGAALQTALQHATGDWAAVLDADLEYRASDLGPLLEPLLSGEANVVFGTRSWSSHSAYSFWYVIGNKGVTLRDERDLQLLDLRRHDLPQGDVHRALPLAAPPGAGVLDRARDRSARAPLRRADLRGARSPTRRARVRKARSSPLSTACGCCGRLSAAARTDGVRVRGSDGLGGRGEAHGFCPARPAAPSCARSPASPSSRSIASRRPATFPGATSSPVTPSSTASTRPADLGRHDGAPVRHRLARDHAVALTPRRDDDDGGPLVVRAEVPWRDEPDRLREQRAQRPVADDDERQPVRGSRKLADALLLGETPDVEGVRWLVGLRRRTRGSGRPAG